jgi:hypothetical protein
MPTKQLTGDELIAWVRKNVVKWDKPVQETVENVAGLQSLREEIKSAKRERE